MNQLPSGSCMFLNPGQILRQLVDRKLNTYDELILNEYRTILFASTAFMHGYPQVGGMSSHQTASEVNFVV